MPFPAIAILIVKIAAVAITAYEAAQIIDDLIDGVKKFQGDLEKAKKELSSYFKKVEEEMDRLIDGRSEVSSVAALTGLAKKDKRPRTIKGAGSRSGSVIKTAIRRKIPFREVISQICAQADAMPILQQRKREGGKIRVKDIPKSKLKIIAKMVGMAAEELSGIENIDDFILVRLKQLAASIVFEFMDQGLDWKSPLKTEVSFGPGLGYADPPVEGTKLTRVGTGLNPFYPAPHRGRGSISADLVIPDYRKQPLDKGNIFAIVEIKFKGDSLKAGQIKEYEKLFDVGAKKKTGEAKALHEGQPVNKGGNVALFRFPEDSTVQPDDASGSSPRNSRMGRG